jgi:hypothetical protein
VLLECSAAPIIATDRHYGKLVRDAQTNSDYERLEMNAGVRQDDLINGTNLTPSELSATHE